MHLFLSAAQAETATAGLAELLKFGVLGIFCVLLIIGLVWVVKAWKASMEQRIADAQGYATGLKDVNDAGNKVSTEVQTTVNALERTCGDLKTNNTTEHTQISSAVNGLREKQGEFIAAAKAASSAKGNG